MKVTPWFSPSVKPVRDGVYETECDEGSRWFNLFENGDWHYGSRGLNETDWHIKDVLPSRFLKRWRGLASEVKQ